MNALLLIFAVVVAAMTGLIFLNNFLDLKRKRSNLIESKTEKNIYKISDASF